MTTTGISRRALMGVTGTALAAAAAAPALASEAPAEAVFANGVSVLSSGPATGYIAGWAKLLTPYLVHGLPHDVTASFEAMGGPDGSTMMVTPGAAFLAWLEGDSRVKYDAGQWIPAMIGTSRLVLVGTRPLREMMTRKRAVRLGAINPIGPELAAMFALDLLGVPVAPVFGQGDTKSLVDGLRRGRIDVALLSGAKIRDALAAARAGGATPLMILASASSCDGPSTRDALLPEIPTFLETAAALNRPVPDDVRFAAYDAATIAASTCFAAVLPDLVRPGTVAFWRRGAQFAADSLSVAAVATQQELSLQTGDCAERLMQRMTGSAAAVVALRTILLHRFGWHAS